MSILDRLRRITRANVNDALDHAESPEKMLRQSVRELEDSIKEAANAASDYAVALKKQEKELELCKRHREEWQHRAEEAVQSGDDEIARKALTEKVKAEERCKTLEPSVAERQKVYAGLRDKLSRLKNNLSDARLKLSELQSRKHAATAEQAFEAQLAKSSASADFEKLEDEVGQAEARAEIEREIRGDVDSDIESATAELQVEAELNALKARKK